MCEYQFNLPNLQAYKNKILSTGIAYPLQVVEFLSDGLLHKLPTPPEEKIGWPWTEETNMAIYSKDINWPKLTIVTPSYNQAQFLEETIRSILLQNYPNLEYIIIDGGSTDDSVQIIKKYSPWISYWQSEKDHGQGNAINQGFSIASGAYYAWINSDDYYLNNTFHQVITTFLKQRVNFVYGYVYNYSATQQKFDLVKTLPVLDYFLRFPTLAQPACFWNEKIHKPVWEKLQCAMDYELWLRLLRNQTRKLIKQPLAVANIHQDAKTSNPEMNAAWANDHELICSEDAHGPVNDWNKRQLLHRYYSILHRLFESIGIF